MIKRLLNKNHYRNKIIITFSAVTILLVALLSKVSYNYLHDFYIDQLTDNVKTSTVLAVGQIESQYKSALKEEIFTVSTQNYFEKLLQSKNFVNIFEEIFIFNKNLKILVHSNPGKLKNIQEPRLLINENEIFGAGVGNTAVSLPFKGNDNNWYLWGFYRFSDEYWLAVRAAAENFKGIDSLSKLLWTFGLIGIFLSIILGYLLARSITKPVDELVEFSTGIGKGKLNLPVPSKMKGELKILSDAMVLMRKNIADNQKEKEKILAQIAHEIRNPLGGIELLTSLIHESVENNTKHKKYSAKILKEITGLKELISSYLNYSRPVPVAPEEIIISDIVDETLTYLKNDIKKYDISINKNIELKKIIFDKIQFRNILMNLLKNSIESINGKGEITIYSGMDKNNKIIRITDNGKGISEEIIGKIFDPFFTTKNNGTGLGLAICRKFCEENSAELTAGNSGKGSIFTIIKEN